jgi:hypothetical protein
LPHDQVPIGGRRRGETHQARHRSDDLRPTGPGGDGRSRACRTREPRSVGLLGTPASGQALKRQWHERCRLEAAERIVDDLFDAVALLVLLGSRARSHLMISGGGGRRSASFCVRCRRARELLAELGWLVDVGLLGKTLEALLGWATHLVEGFKPLAGLGAAIFGAGHAKSNLSISLL